MRRFWKIAGIGCGGLIALVVLLVIVAALFGGQNTSQQSTQSSSSSSGDQSSSSSSKNVSSGKSGGQSKESAVSMGQAVTAGNVQWTVTNAYKTNQLTSDFMEPKQGNFVVVDFNFLNNDTKAVPLDQTSLSLLDSINRTHSPDPNAFMGYIPEDKQIFLEQVNPGVRKDGEVIFTVPADASGLTLEVGDTNPLTNNDGYVDLSNIG